MAITQYALKHRRTDLFQGSTSKKWAPAVRNIADAHLFDTQEQAEAEQLSYANPDAFAIVSFTLKGE